jgi:hypothetical protein
MANPQLPVGYGIKITIDPKDLLGSTVPDSLSWSSSDPTDTPVTQDPTSLIATIAALSPAVDTVITATDPSGNVYTYAFDAVVDAPTNLVATVSAPFKLTPPAAV